MEPRTTKHTHRTDRQHGTMRVPSCCGMPMAYSGQQGFYCLRCGAKG